MKKYKTKKLSQLATCVLFSLLANSAYSVDFNTDLLDAEDKKNIDFSRFSHAGYILPGTYQLYLQVNDQSIGARTFSIPFYQQVAPKTQQKILPQACLSTEIIEQLGLTFAAKEKLSTWHNGECADLHQLAGVELRPAMSEGTLYINIPQSWLEYSDASWLPPSRWDNGIAGLLFDYNLSANASYPKRGEKTQSVSYYGTTGANFQAWRLRADYHGNYDNSSKNSNPQITFSRIYLYRAIAPWRANLMLGENSVQSDMFNSWNYTGASLSSSEQMLPPHLRGYAPQVSGIAETNAHVIITQLGRVLYDSTVAAGPFTINSLDRSLRGRLDVKIIEQNGQVKTSQVDINSVPFLTRPGRVQYKLSSGRSRLREHNTQGPVFLTGEISWGMNNHWTLNSGTIAAGDYNALALGTGVDLNQFGTLSSDITQSQATIAKRGKLQGKSWRFNYAKRFDANNSDISLTGYRFSERNYMTMGQYLDARYCNSDAKQQKESYSIAFNKHFEDWQTSVGLQYSYNTYWDDNASNYYTFSINRYFDTLQIKNISIGLTASRSQYQPKNKQKEQDKSKVNDSVYLRLSMPLESGRLSYSGNINNNRYAQSLSYSDSTNNGLDSYSISASSSGKRMKQQNISGSYSHNTPVTNLSGNIYLANDGYASLGLNASGGATITAKGAALHAGGMNGGTRLMVDTDGIANVPIDGSRVLTNRWGIGVATDVSSYYRNTTSVDLNNLPEDMEATRSVVESMLTEGAIGYRKFEILKGTRLFAAIRLTDNTFPPFSASVSNAQGRELGLIADGGLAWLSGITPGEKLNVSWGGVVQCKIDIPQTITAESQILLPCRKA